MIKSLLEKRVKSYSDRPTLPMQHMLFLKLAGKKSSRLIENGSHVRIV